jgi:glutathione synthase/RimK-type ligase-like ATP-grasp enzyme
MKRLAIFFDVKSRHYEKFDRELRESQTDNLSIDLLTYRQIAIAVGVGSELLEATCEGVPVQDYSAAYFKKSKDFIDVARPLALIFDHYGGPVVDKMILDATYGEKLFQYVFLARQGVPVPPTLFYSRDWVAQKFETISSRIGMPFIMKDLAGKEGDCNYLIRDEESFNQAIHQHPQVDFVFQKFIPNNSDYRILVMGDEIGELYERVRVNTEDHRNNGALGAQTIFHDVSTFHEDIKNLAINVAKLSNIQIAGVDVVTSIDDGKNYVLEINNSPLILKEKLMAPMLEYLVSISRQ